MRTKPTWTVYLVVLSCLWAMGIQCCHAPFGWAEAAAEAAPACHTVTHPSAAEHPPEEPHSDDCHCHQWAAVPATPTLSLSSGEAGHTLGLELSPLTAFMPAHWQPVLPLPPPWPDPPPVPTTGLQIVRTTYLLI